MKPDAFIKKTSVLFDPNSASREDAGIFGLSFDIKSAKLVLLPVAWDATTSYGSGAAFGPHAILQASKQIDLFDSVLGHFYQAGIIMLDHEEKIKEWNQITKKLIPRIKDQYDSAQQQTIIEQINTASMNINDYVYTETKKLLAQNKIVGIVGGDHSVPFGAIKAHVEKYPNMGVLHIDAHADARNAFNGFEYSHASIMYNVITKTTLTKLVQVGIRDFCQEEYDFIKKHSSRIITFFDSKLHAKKYQGMHWARICEEIIQHLPHEVYVSFDIDGLDPRFCPHTGTPVPGGLDFNEACYLLQTIVQSGRKIIGFDLSEVSLGCDRMVDRNDPAAEWDANVGARILFKLAGFSLSTH